MANVKLIFQNLYDETELQCYATTKKEIYIQIKDYSNINFIYLDKETSVRLVRELKKQIGLLESEVSNG
jgi:uncharacterized pyridoxamine 5'-phosphate oxidase family protein